MKAKSVGLSFAALAVAISPVMVSAATSSQNNTVTAVMAEVISVTASNPGNISITPNTAGPRLTSVSHNVTVNSNVGAGYNLTVANNDATLTMAGSGTAAGQTIAASANTTAAPAALAANTWGFAVAGGVFDASYSVETNSGTSTSEWAGVPANASPYNIRSTTAVASNEITTVWYAVEVDYTKVSGSYSDTVVYTGTTK